jgi:hypothetical protein
LLEESDHVVDSAQFPIVGSDDDDRSFADADSKVSKFGNRSTGPVEIVCGVTTEAGHAESISIDGDVVYGYAEPLVALRLS